MNARLITWLIGVAVFLAGGDWLYQGLPYYASPSDPSVDSHQVYYGAAVMIVGVIVMLYSRRISRPEKLS